MDNYNNEEKNTELVPEERPEEIINEEPIEKEPEEERKKLPFWLGIIVGVCAAVVAFVVISVFVVGNSFQTASTSGNSYDTKINTILAYLDKYYLGEVDEQTVEDSLASGLLSGIGDKYAEYYTAEEFQDLLTSESGSYSGIGVRVIADTEGNVYVYEVFKTSPAKEAGMQVGDIIVEVDGIREFETLDDLVLAVRGEAGTTVNIVVDRDGTEIPMTVTRQDVEVDAVEYEMLENNIGYIHIDQFVKVAVDQFDQALNDLESQGMTSLIIDVRDNPGGDYDTVVSMCNRILPAGPIMTVEDKSGTVKTENSDGQHELKIPMVVLINENSASASEVFTGAIDDYDMATIIGETSYGKGVVQSIFALSDGSGLKFTTMKYYTPSGDSVDGVGITPDIEVSLPDDIYDDGIFEQSEDTQLQKAIEVLSE